jgi:hypothetical protein
MNKNLGAPGLAIALFPMPRLELGKFAESGTLSF